MSQVSRRNLSFLDPSVDHLIDLVEALTQFGVVQSFNGSDLGEAGPQNSVICAGAKQGGAPTQPRHSVTVSPRDPLDQAVQAKPAQVISHLARGHVVGGFTQQGSPMVAQVAVGKTSRQETKHQERAEQCLHGHVGEAQTGPDPSEAPDL